MKRFSAGLLERLTWSAMRMANFDVVPDEATEEQLEDTEEVFTPDTELAPFVLSESSELPEHEVVSPFCN